MMKKTEHTITLTPDDMRNAVLALLKVRNIKQPDVGNEPACIFIDGVALDSDCTFSWVEFEQDDDL